MPVLLGFVLVLMRSGGRASAIFSRAQTYGEDTYPDGVGGAPPNDPNSVPREARPAGLRPLDLPHQDKGALDGEPGNSYALHRAPLRRHASTSRAEGRKVLGPAAARCGDVKNGKWLTCAHHVTPHAELVGGHSVGTSVIPNVDGWAQHVG